MTMTPQQHQRRHIELFNALDELIADFITHTNKTLGKTNLIDLMMWAGRQAKTQQGEGHGEDGHPESRLDVQGTYQQQGEGGS